MKKIIISIIAILHFGITALAQEPPNILIFLVDDLRPELGSYGNTRIKTPHIDALAKDGVQFQKAYAQQALCAPSRMSILTGLRPETIGIYSLFTPLRSVHKEMVTLPQVFKEQGYTTVSVGKVYHHGNDDAESWSILTPREQNSWVKPENLAIIDSLKKSGSKKTNGPAFENADVADEGYKDGRAVNKAIDILQKIKNEKFMMIVGLTKPHLPFNAPKKYWDLYNKADFLVPAKQAPTDVASLALPKWGELRAYHGIPEEGFIDDQTTKNLIHGYYASVSYMDAQMGKVMDELTRLDLRKNTIVVFMSDHGYKLGEYGTWCKHSNFEIDVNVPFIVSRETSYANRKTNVSSDALIENIDVFPTLAAACGIKTPTLEGESILPLLDNPTMQWDEAAFSLYPKGKNIIGLTCTDGVLRYTEWWDTKAQTLIENELYLNQPNYMEITANLVKNKAYAKDITRMASLLEEQYPKKERPSYPKNDK